MRDVYALMINNIIAVGYQTTRWSPARQLLKHLRDTLFEDLKPARLAWCCLFYGWVLSPCPLIYFVAPFSILFTPGFFHAFAQMPPRGIHSNVTLPKMHLRSCRCRASLPQRAHGAGSNAATTCSTPHIVMTITNKEASAQSWEVVLFYERPFNG